VTLYVRFAAHMDALLDAMVAAGDLPSVINRKAVTVEPPRDASHGDLATNAAMVLAKPAGTNPRALAEKIAARLDALSEVASVSIAGPGFLNLSLTPETWRPNSAPCEQGADYGRSDSGAGVTVNVEYVSANPTGPMHMGHCRGAVVGDALATLLEAMRAQGHSRILYQRRGRAGRCARALGASALPRGAGRGYWRDPGGLYPGDYLVPVGHKLAAEYGAKFVGAEEANGSRCSAGGCGDDGHDPFDDLALLGIHHDVFRLRSRVAGGEEARSGGSVAARAGSGL
jgi:arginyl-tRNA synthetase